MQRVGFGAWAFRVASLDRFESVCLMLPYLAAIRFGRIGRRFQ